jgi:purine-nucleoside phosphorylase
VAGGSSPLDRSLTEAAAFLRARFPLAPRVGVLLGSGLGDFAEQVQSATVIPLADIPFHPNPTVMGHAGILVFGNLEGVNVAVWKGRSHFYEGRSMGEIGFPIWLLARLGGSHLILTNAAGGLAERLKPGDLMVLNDHINLPGLCGHNPLRGNEVLCEGDRFVDLSNAYDPGLRQLALETAAAEGFTTHEGVYAMVGGPNYETRAEARLLRQLGADAVGMSTVPETIVARQVGLRVVAISAITNALLAPDEQGTSHQDVLRQADRLKPRLATLVKGIVAGLGRESTA